MTTTSLGAMVRKVRERHHGLSLREFARRLGISPAYLCDIEHDRRRLSLTVAKRLHRLGPHTASYWLKMQVNRDLNALYRRRQELDTLLTEEND